MKRPRRLKSPRERERERTNFCGNFSLQKKTNPMIKSSKTSFYWGVGWDEEGPSLSFYLSISIRIYGFSFCSLVFGKSDSIYLGNQIIFFPLKTKRLAKKKRQFFRPN